MAFQIIHEEVELGEVGVNRKQASPGFWIALELGFLGGT